MGVTRQTLNPYEQHSDGGNMAMSPGHIESLAAHGRTMDLDRQEGVGLHSGHIDAMMRGEFRAGRGRGFAEGQEDSRAEWPIAYDRGWTQGASEGEEYVLAQVAGRLEALIADVAAARGGFKKLTDKKVTKAMLHEALSTIADQLAAMHAQHTDLYENLTGA